MTCPSQTCVTASACACLQTHFVLLHCAQQNIKSSSFRVLPAPSSRTLIWQPWLEGPSQFFAYWENFSTQRGFWWCDEYNPMDASNRQEKRAIEKHNHKCREIGKKEYNDHVRRLATWVKKRDPRRAQHLKRVSEEAAAKAEQQRHREAELRRLRKEKILAEGDDMVIEVWFLFGYVDTLWMRCGCAVDALWTSCGRAVDAPKRAAMAKLPSLLNL